MNQQKISSFCIRFLIGICMTAMLVAHGAVAGSSPMAHGGGAVKNPEHAQLQPVTRAGFGDADLDGVQDYADNCFQVPNADQRDTDADGFGNACDADLNNDGAVNFFDLALMKAQFFTNDEDADLNGDGQVNFIDLGIMKTAFFAAPGPSGMSCAGTAPCPGALQFDWPMQGSDGGDWVINNYVDLDPGAGLLDYAGGAKTYNGHNGVDIDVPTFRSMDNDFPVLAAAQGVVIDLADGNPDRNVFCAGNWNFVTVGHPNGWTTTYGHLKKSSVAVAVGDVVNAGDVLGVVGSSGCSTAPHLHFEVRDEQGNVVSPFENGMWNAPPLYDTPINVMDITVQDQAMSEIVEVIDPPPDIDIVGFSRPIGIGLSVAGGKAGDTLLWRIANAAGGAVYDFQLSLTQTYRHSYWYINVPWHLDSGGDHTVEIYANGLLVRSSPLQIGGLPPDWQIVRWGVPVADYPQVFNDAVAAGYRLTWIDGYNVNGATFINALFDLSPSGPWVSAHGLNGSQYQALFNSQVADGYRLFHVDSYLDGGEIRYAAIFLRQFAQLFTAYHGVTVAQHQASFADLAANGWVAANISIVEFQGSQFVTALYTSKPMGSWFAYADLTEAEFEDGFHTLGGGRSLRYLDVHTINGVPSYSAIWAGDRPAGYAWFASMDASLLEQTLDPPGFLPGPMRVLTGFDDGAGNANFAGFAGR